MKQVTVLVSRLLTDARPEPAEFKWRLRLAGIEPEYGFTVRSKGAYLEQEQALAVTGVLFPPYDHSEMD